MGKEWRSQSARLTQMGTIRLGKRTVTKIRQPHKILDSRHARFCPLKFLT
jgi:hypothetical protein